jgi:hypothetical protein
MMDMTREESDEESVVDEDVSNEAARVEESSPDAEDVIWAFILFKSSL